MNTPTKQTMSVGNKQSFVAPKPANVSDQALIEWYSEMVMSINLSNMPQQQKDFIIMLLEEDMQTELEVRQFI